jgi:hypothetical protein
MPDNVVHLIDGSSSYITLDMRFQAIASLDGKVKIPHGSGYEHSSYSGEVDVLPQGTPPRFVWVAARRSLS